MAELCSLNDLFPDLGIRVNFVSGQAIINLGSATNSIAGMVCKLLQDSCYEVTASTRADGGYVINVSRKPRDLAEFNFAWTHQQKDAIALSYAQAALQTAQDAKQASFVR